MARFAIQVVQGYVSIGYHCFDCRLHEVQANYYTSQQVSIFVHITFMHSPTSIEDDRKILREYHFYISDD